MMTLNLTSAVILASDFRAMVQQKLKTQQICTKKHISGLEGGILASVRRATAHLSLKRQPDVGALSVAIAII